MIAHRLSTIRDANKIIVLDKGNIAESGTHEQLFSNKGTYYKMWQYYQQTLDWQMHHSDMSKSNNDEQISYQQGSENV